MFNKTILSAGLAAAVLAAPAVWAADSGSQTFITTAIQGNLAEISVGQLALQKGGTDAVKQFGQTLVSDHTKANQNAMAAAKTLGVTPPTDPTAEQKQMHDKLAGESGAAFDRDFASGMVDDHEKAIADYQKAATDDKDAAGQYASQTLPDLQKHLTTAQALTGNAASATTGAAASAPSGNGVALVPGANSFTEGQAKSRIEKAGFSGVSKLKQDHQGIWRGTATKNGQSVPVGLDFKGDVAGK